MQAITFLIKKFRYSSIMIVISYRPIASQNNEDVCFQPTTQVRNVLENGGGLHITLPPLKHYEVEMMVHSRWVNAPVEIRETITKLSGGNPLLVAHLIEEIEGWGLPLNMEGSLVNDVRDVIPTIVEKRLSNLLPTEQDIIEFSSVMGDPIDMGLVRKCVQLDEIDFEESYSSMMAASDLITYRDGEHRFSHDLVRRAVYNHIDFDRRMSKHNRLAQILEKDRSIVKS